MLGSSVTEFRNGVCYSSTEIRDSDVSTLIHEIMNDFKDILLHDLSMACIH